MLKTGYIMGLRIETNSETGMALHSGQTYNSGTGLNLNWPAYAESEREFQLEGRSYFPLRKNKETIAYLVCRCMDADGEYDRLFLQHAVSLFTLYLTKQYAVHEIEDNQWDKFLKMWVLGEITDAQTLLLHAAMLNIQLKDRYFIAVTSKAGTSHTRMRSVCGPPLPPKAFCLF